VFGERRAERHRLFDQRRTDASAFRLQSIAMLWLLLFADSEVALHRRPYTYSHGQHVKAAKRA
jgi:hypothetical protein